MNVGQAVVLANVVRGAGVILPQGAVVEIVGLHKGCDRYLVECQGLRAIATEKDLRPVPQKAI
ncbi:hypothetical protein [Thermoleptolyngbya sp. M55_K2018_002]|uniref:hypothetical protein n=1 Tax=Thermoleptolyngbya sp. M55_K2018_002 TaxID=2747808 RepID=UPI0019F1C25E|nr:hypothetical protein [Thermoleptolyngbya sp. M55_K2018_002]HIK42138.1 hypothetical protein [Thermoleptolyngbya sp. M55_K2018_002]